LKNQENNLLFILISLKTEALVINLGVRLTLINIIIDGRSLAYKVIDPSHSNCISESLFDSINCCDPEKDYQDATSPCFLNERKHLNLNKVYPRHCFIEENLKVNSSGNIQMINSDILFFFGTQRYLGFACLSSNTKVEIKNSSFSDIYFARGIFSLENETNEFNLDLSLTIIDSKLIANNKYKISFEGSSLPQTFFSVGTKARRGSLNIFNTIINNFVSDTVIIFCQNLKNLWIYDIVINSTESEIFFLSDVENITIKNAYFNNISISRSDASAIFIILSDQILINLVSIQMVNLNDTQLIFSFEEVRNLNFVLTQFSDISTESGLVNIKNISTVSIDASIFSNYSNTKRNGIF
jgi:hypothetical protein